MELDEIKSLFTASEILERFGVDVHQGNILCPFHADTTPSMRVHRDGTWCFSCVRGWDVIALVEHYRNVGFVDAVCWILREAGVPTTSWSRREDTRAAFRPIADTLELVFRQSLEWGKKAERYLDGRGISEELIAGKVGFLPPRWEPDNQKAALEAGLLNANGNCLFKGRLIIPIIRHGRIVNLYGRLIAPNDKRPTHVYCATTEPRQPDTLWGLDEVRRGREVYLCEAIIDALTLKTHGLTAIAAFGTQGLNEARLKELSVAKPKQVVVAFDTDENGSGQKASRTATRQLFSAGIESTILQLPGGDCNEFFREHSVDEFAALPKEDGFRHLCQCAAQEETAQTRAQSARECVELLASRDDAFLMGELLPVVQESFPHMELSTLQKQAGKLKAKKAKKARFSGVELAELYMSEAPTICVAGKFYRYEDGVYRVWRNADINKATIGHLGKGCQPHHLQAVLAMLENLADLDPQKVNQDPRINLKNGLLDPITRELSPHDPEVISTIQANVAYDEDADAAIWWETIDQILPEDESLKLLAEMMGYALVRDRSWQKGFILYGTGANGKSTVIDVMTALVDKDNCSNVQLHQLERNFSLGRLENKLVNFATEVRTKNPVDDATLKQLTGGDMIQGEHKFKDPFDFRSLALWIIACNALPEARDKSWGYFRRWIILPFPVRLDPRRMDRHRAHRIIEEELPGVLNFALGGVKRLYENKEFTIGPNSRKALTEYERTINPLL